MRFVIAIVTFVVAAIMIVVGFGQRTIWAPPKSFAATAQIPDGTHYIVIGGRTLNSVGDRQTLELAGAAEPFIAYGRSEDVLAWLGSETYTRISFAEGDHDLTVREVTPDPADDQNAAPPAPTGGLSAEPAALPVPLDSDLWLEQYRGPSAERVRMSVPDDVTVLIASLPASSTDALPEAPSRVTLTWGIDDKTPWAGPLIVGGGVLLVVGLVLYLFALRHLRRSRGPRRGGKPPKLPRAPRAKRYRPVPAITSGHGRRAAGRPLVAILAGALALGLTGCSPDYWPSWGSAPSAPTTTSTPLPGGGDAPAPALTLSQLQRIVGKIAAVAERADEKRDAKLIATRFTGAALTERTTNYKIRGKVSSYPRPQAIPASRIVAAIPEAAAAWPKVASVIVQDSSNAKAAPLDLVLVQQTPRDDYKVAYAITLEAGAKVPDLPPVATGAPLVPPDSKLLSLAPNALAASYASVFATGSKSEAYPLFDMSADALSPQLGAAYKAKQIKKAQQGKTSSLSFVDAAGPTEPIALATLDSGALVAVTVDETAAQKVTTKGATVRVDNPKGPTAALTGKKVTTKGFQTTFEYQLLFYVPPAESDELVRLIGYTQAAVAAKELK